MNRSYTQEIYKTNRDLIPYEKYTDKNVILDIDETLVCSSEKPNVFSKLNIYNDPNYFHILNRLYVLDFDFNGKSKRNNIMWGITRPGLKDFLIFCLSYFDKVIIWSAGHKSYVDMMTGFMFKDLHTPHKVYSRESCKEIEYNNEKIKIKPIQMIMESAPDLDITYENTFVVDNLETTFIENPDNGILIPDYLPKLTAKGLLAEDERLYELMDWFVKPEVIKSKDVRTIYKGDIFKK